jgi:hypothetical protein
MSKFLLNLLLQISKALVDSKIQFSIRNFFFHAFGPAELAAHPTFGPAGSRWPLLSRAESNPAGPASPCVDDAFAEVRFSFWFTPSRAGRLSLIPLTTGPRLSAPSPTSSHPSSPAPPPIPGHRAPPSSAPRVPPSRYHLAFISPPLISLLNPPPSSMALKSLTPALTALATPPRCSPGPYKRRAPPTSSTTPSPASFSISPCLSSVLTKRRRLPVLHHHRPASTAPPEPR